MPIILALALHSQDTYSSPTLPNRKDKNAKTKCTNHAQVPCHKRYAIDTA